MCRRIITHYMHHDVATPMILDPVATKPVIYANPLHTNYHRCELMLPPLNLLLNSHVEKCPYHTCCMPHVQVEYCRDVLAYLEHEGEGESFEPEECEGFILEHHHKMLLYFGNEFAYREVIPATWRNLASTRGENPDWLPCFAHEPKNRPDWEEKFFAECEKLYTLENDATVLGATLQDLTNSGSGEMLRAAKYQILKIESTLHEQRRLVFDLLEWASESCNTCER
ncbi:hypothetical protein ONZ43_g1906 [Nemania bipapillata]|uniref:Uncharacterized protein n=1 Tax=Nemania bipapillata TaxID=110536 RepID=A0ACC2J2K5_9PEZI|nr:hypothetical protein ONZ43_g1906 [Nemania bipapillata]